MKRLKKRKKKSRKLIEGAYSAETLSTSKYYFLRWIAIITMLIDNVAYLFSDMYQLDSEIYVILRGFGRIAFPLFCYLLVESFFFTKNRKKHLKNILIIAFISEIPFNIFHDTKVLTLEFQNVCFGLAAGFAAMCVLEKNYENHFFVKRAKHDWSKKYFSRLIKLDLWGLLFCATTFLNFDYEWRGFLLITMLYFAKKKKFKKLWQFFAIAFFAVSFFDEIYAFCIIDIILIYFVQAKKSTALLHCKAEEKARELFSRALSSTMSRCLCKVFYPVHLIILITIRFIMT